MMKKIHNYLFLLLAVVLLAVPGRAFAWGNADGQFTQNYNFTVIPKGNGVYTFKLLAFVGASSANCWAYNKGNHPTKVTVKYDNTKSYTLLEYWSENGSNTDEGYRDLHVKLNPDKVDAGNVIFTCGGARSTVSGNTGETTEQMPNGKTIDQQYNGTYLEFEWVAPYNVLNGKTFTIEETVSWDKSFWSNQETRTLTLGTYTYSSALTAPTLAGSYLDPSATAGSEGQNKIVGYATTAPKSVSLYLDNQTKPTVTYANSNDMHWEFIVPQCDTTQTFTMEGVFNENGNDITLRSAPISVRPYHKIKDMHVYEQQDYQRVNDGRKVVEWTRDFSDPKDQISSDYYIVERACRSDFSDVEQLATVYLTDTIKGAKFQYIDSATVAAYNTKGGKYNYYRVRRASAYAYFTTTKNAFSVVDSVENICCYLPAVSKVVVKQDENYDANHKVNVRVEMQIEKYLNDEHWNPAANVVIYTMRKNGINDETDSLTVSGNQVKYDASTYSYYLERDMTVNIPEMIYNFGAKVSIPEDYSYLKLKNTAGYSPKWNHTEFKISELTSPTNVKPTQGTEYGNIKLTWTMPETKIDSVWIVRADSAHAGNFERIASLKGFQNFYVDKTAKIGNKYLYAVMIYATYNGKVYTANSLYRSAKIYGWICPTGKVAGKVTTTDGVGIDHQLVRLEGGDLKKEVYTDADGNYVIEGIPLSNDTKNYYLVVSSQGLTFVNSDGDTQGSTVYLSGNNSLVEDVNFTCTSEYRFSGRVLFHNSTVPVAGANFYVNGKLLKDKEGKALTSDNNGDFAFNVPSHQVTVQVRKKGHKFLGEGYIHDKSDETKTTFTPNSKYDGLVLYDQTKVLLRGRIVGGDKQAALPLGQGLSTNNLGDSITLQMKLEGNNTANIVYLRDDQNKDTLLVNNVQTYGGKVVTRTSADFKRKSIDIHVDNATGEYAMEVFPTKYKVTQAYAQGYASFFPNGEVSQVLDLTDSVSTDSLATALATYSITYHSDVTLDFKQMLWGYTEVKYLGSTEYTDVDLNNQTFTVHLATPTGKDGAYEYLFGENHDKPVFLHGQTYWLRGSAHEDYYYNNVTVNNSKHDQMVVKKGVATVENGLASATAEAQTFELDSLGRFMFNFTVNNTDFSATGEDALHRLNASVEVNGYHYKAAPIEAYVTGQRDKDGNIYTDKNSNIRLFDVLRDPPGSGSYAYLGKGATYNTSRDVKMEVSVSGSLNFKQGTNYTGVVGNIAGQTVFTGTVTKGSTDWEFSIDLPKSGVKASGSGTYNFTTNQRISTSSEPEDEGAIADVYYGSVSNTAWKTQQVVCFIDSFTYALSKPSIDAGLIKVIQTAKEQDGQTRYLVVAEKFLVGETVPTTFIYSTRDIIGTVLPKIMQQRNSLIVGGDSVTLSDVQAMANRLDKTFYYYKGKSTDSDYGINYEVIHPNGKVKDGFTDEVAAYNKLIMKWLGLISANEKLKLVAIGSRANGNSNVQTFSVSAGQKIEHSENIEYCVSETSVKPLILGTSSIPGISSQGASLANEGLSTFTRWLDDAWGHSFKNNANKQAATSQAFRDNLTNLLDRTAASDDNKTNAINTTTIETPVSKLTITYKPSFNVSYSDDTSGDSKTTVESGYEISMGSDSYLNVSVISTPADSILNLCSDLKTALQWVTGANNDYSEYLHDYVFYVNGGATRNPWMDADSTLLYQPGTPLGMRTLKIDNPVIHITDPEVSNIGESDKAIFQVRLSNDSEVTGTQQLSKPSEFTLSIDDASNPNGAKISIDGMPLTDGRTFTLSPGTSITKTMEVTRGNGYNFDGLRLNLACKDDDNNSSDATFSVHFLPSSSPVKISSPGDKWVLNTLSSKDTTGYFIPVVIDGYDTHYDNFDHIELQYKKSTEGESGWVNLCSYYVSDSLYQKASGTKSKEMIVSGRITHHFYGEKDPIEMKYDLRAVTFCRLGTGYVTKSSDIISGTKDTRCPTIFGTAQPVNGILKHDGSIILPFSEPIAYNYLDETSNFEVKGYTNKSGLDTDAGLVFSGDCQQDAYTTVNRSLDAKDFTIDMLVQTDEDHKAMTFFSQCDKAARKYMSFGVNDQRQLVANINGKVFKSTVLDEPLTEQMTHVGMICKKYTDESTDEGRCNISFFVGNSIKDGDASNESSSPIYHGNAPIHLGVNSLDSTLAPFKGRMLEVRLWNRALDPELISEFNGKHVDGYTQRIIAYWPLHQAQGTTATDELNGADLQLRRTAWHTINGNSLLINNKALPLVGRAFQRTDLQDYTLSFWYRMNGDTQTGYLFSAGADDLAEQGMCKMRIGYDNGKMIVRSQGVTTVLDENGATLDNKWHNIMLSVSHSQNVANAYIDGKIVSQIPGDSIGGIQPNDVYLGGNFNANIDHLSLWHQALPTKYIQDRYCDHLSGDEMGLWVYLPFNGEKESTQGTISYPFTVKNLATGNNNFYGQPMLTEYSEDDNKSTANAPVLNSQEMNKLKFSWASDGSNLLLNLDMSDYEINHRNLFFTVRDVEDLNGNPMQNPYTWTVYADRNILRWIDQGAEGQLNQGEEKELSAQWSNTTSKSTNYSITSSSPYIQITSETSGVADPSHTNILHYTILDGFAPGTYNEFLWLYDEDNKMISNYEINFTVNAKKPEWAVDRKKYDQTMSISATVYQTDESGLLVQDNDTRDIIGAFIDSECVGTSNINKSKGLYGLSLVVYGSQTTAGKEVKFYLWDASEGSTRVLSPDSTIHFTSNALIGIPPASPLRLTESQSTMQNITLSEGWNWISFNQSPINKNSANELFFSNDIFSNGDQIKCDGKRVEYLARTKKWSGDDMVFSPDKVYHVYVTNQGEAHVIGTTLTDDMKTINVHRGWNAVPYLFTYSLPINRFFTDFQIGEKAKEGDMIKGLTSFSALSSQYGWIGTLQTLQPGEGYYLYHTGNDCTISFKSVTPVSSKAQAAKSVASQGEGESMMPVIAEMVEGENIPEDAVVRAYAGAQMVAEAEPIMLPDGKRLYFLAVRGKTAASGSAQGEGITFVTQDENENVIGVGRVRFNDTTGIGTIEKPFELSTQSTTTSTGDVYDLRGIKWSTNSKPAGIYIQNGKKLSSK